MKSCGLRSFFKDLDVEVKEFTLFGDKKSSIHLATNPMFHARTKHIEIHYHFIREEVLAKEVNIKYINTKDQVAFDMMT